MFKAWWKILHYTFHWKINTLLVAKELWISVNIWGSYCHDSVISYFRRYSVYISNESFNHSLLLTQADKQSVEQDSIERIPRQPVNSLSCNVRWLLLGKNVLDVHVDRQLLTSFGWRGVETEPDRQPMHWLTGKQQTSLLHTTHRIASETRHLRVTH